MVGGAKRGRTRSLTVHPSIHLFHTLFLALVLYRLMKLEPSLGHSQINPLDRWPVHHTHSYPHSLQSPVHLSCPVCLWIVGETQRRPTSTQRDSCSSWDSSTALHYTTLMIWVLLRIFFYFICIFSKLFIFIFVFLFFTSKFSMCDFFTSNC